MMPWQPAGADVRRPVTGCWTRRTAAATALLSAGWSDALPSCGAPMRRLGCPESCGVAAGVACGARGSDRFPLAAPTTGTAGAAPSAARVASISARSATIALSSCARLISPALKAMSKPVAASASCAALRGAPLPPSTMTTWTPDANRTRRRTERGAGGLQTRRRGEVSVKRISQPPCGAKRRRRIFALPRPSGPPLWLRS